MLLAVATEKNFGSRIVKTMMRTTSTPRRRLLCDVRASNARAFLAEGEGVGVTLIA
jgi:hypothetical protein